nr:polyhomeotic-like protein 2 isoform X3 [Podarcis muralis]XP_028596250.1 polyhomeotic-like protein 2 isoform X3 [Podarcis muralis]XP_028596251.1 polyhomeotic-like protein 2 isoform X3 [Podarcis muralis]XP_028596252.1 polyhomeotic-like protein 2 isoform X3 [Podarcis muralis]
MVTMENEQLPAPPPTSSATAATATSNGRQAGPQISVYGGIPDRQTVQVIQQALHRQPNTAAQYLQQMYAAQQQHLMLQTAALQQQHLSSTQLQSLAAVQQASLAANRQNTSSSNNGPTQTPPQQSTINLATSPAAAQLINRAQGVNSAAASGIAQQAVLLGNASSPTLTASQAQMYLRAQMAQQSNLVQVARSLGRALPLSPQLIFTPTATVAAVQPEGATTTQPSTTTAQVQNSSLRTQQAAAQGLAPSLSQQLPTLAMKPTPSNSSHSTSSPASQGKTAGQAPGGKTGVSEHAPEHLRKGEGGGGGGSSSSGGAGNLDGRGGSTNRTVTSSTTHPLIAPAYSQLQTHQLLQQQKPIQHQFVIQQQHPHQPLQPRPPQLQVPPPPTPSLGAPPSLQAQGPSQNQAPATSLPACQAPSQHKPAASQPSQQHTPHPPGPPALGAQRLEAGSPARPTGCPNHAGQRKFQHASAVILQLQPAVGTPPLSNQENSRKDPFPAEKPPAESRVAQPLLPPQGALTTPPLAAPPEQQASEGTGTTPPHEAGRDSLRRTPPDAPGSPGMTSGNNGSSASTVAGAPQNGENKPPQAIVKPQILTHVIEGFVIQEGAEPFPLSVQRPPSPRPAGPRPPGSPWKKRRGRGLPSKLPFADSLVEAPPSPISPSLEVGRSSLLVGSLKQKYAQDLLAEKPQHQDNNTTTTTDSEMEDPYLQESKDDGSPPKLKCELCGRLDFAYKFKRSKRFCSMACAKRYNVGCTKRVGLFHPDRSKLQKPNTPPHGRRRTCKGSLPPLSKENKKQAPVSLPPGSGPISVSGSLQLAHAQEDSSRCSDNSSYEEPLSPLSASSSASRRRQGERDMELPDVHVRDLVGIGHHFLPSEPTKWNVEDVYEFIRSLPGCQEIAEEFRAQEIDGQALLLLKEDHLMSAMNIKLGPALKIYARICMLKDS